MSKYENFEKHCRGGGLSMEEKKDKSQSRGVQKMTAMKFIREFLGIQDCAGCLATDM